ncbi:uncharacterized protein LOC132738353 isoform X2 [Ruditapes philippinarum]|uniref:uncharacterized protein LOC132738353 isoform X2 n=1 Tax=Ruditapes philippinarum TaxID=129788 RepID=UPI00295B81F1|nr:uncharacterized protein LOC132738353 isoform X2 [Ruditapes philippinarum]
MSANHCRELVCWENIGSEFVIDIIKRLLPTDTQELKSEEYYLFLHHTVSVIMKKAGVPERTVLLMLLEDFNDRFERKTKRGHVTCTIDTSQEAIMIGFEEVECLKLYVDHARKRVIRELKESNKDYVESEYLFIGYDGKPIVNESFDDTIVKETESEKKALTCSTLSQESVQMEACRKDLNDDKHIREEKIQTSEVQDMKMNHLSLVKTNLIGVSNYDEPKSTEDFSLLVENVNDDRDGEVNDDKNQELNDDKPICDGRLQTSEGQDNKFSLTCGKINGENMKNKNEKEMLHSMNASPTRPSNTGLPARSPAGQREKTTKSISKTKLVPIGSEEITIQNESLDDFILNIGEFLASDRCEGQSFDGIYKLSRPLRLYLFYEN